MNQKKEKPKTVKIFMDLEFTGLTQNTSLVSIGCVSDCGAVFYAENYDYAKEQANEWIQRNVIDNLILLDKINPENGNYFWRDYQKQNSLFIKLINNESIANDCIVAAYVPWMIHGNLKSWLESFGEVNIQMVVDCGQYDWVLFCELFGGGLSLPTNVSYIPFELSTLFELKGFDPDIDRVQFLEEFYHKDNPNNLSVHHALIDAYKAKLCYTVLNSLPWKI